MSAPPTTVRVERFDTLVVDELATLVAASEREGLAFVRRLVDEWSSGVNRFAGDGEALLAVRDGGAVVGVCGLNIDPYAAAVGVGRLRHLYVAPPSRRRGVGRQLVEAVIVAARGRFRVLHLRTHNPAAAALYERVGFRPIAGGAHATHALVL